MGTWNVNSVRLRVRHVVRWLEEANCDVLCLQETKVEEAAFPFEEFLAAGYQSVASGEGARNGVAILSRLNLQEHTRILPGVGQESRFLVVKVCDVYVLCVYVPNASGVDGSDFAKKLRWLAHIRYFLDTLDGPLIVCGDYNVAPAPSDVDDVLNPFYYPYIHPRARAGFAYLLGADLRDSVEHDSSGGCRFTWWDYREKFDERRGMRLDAILYRKGYFERVEHYKVFSHVRQWEKPSDHAPLATTFVLRNIA